MALFWHRLEARLPVPEREEARWIVGASLVERNEVVGEQIRCFAELLTETKKSLVAADVARLESAVRDLQARFLQKAEATGLPVDKLLPKFSERELHLCDSQTGLSLVGRTTEQGPPQLRDEEALLRSCGNLEGVEQREAELRQALECEYVWLEFEAERAQRVLARRVDEPRYFLELQALVRKLEKEVVREISVALMTPLQKKRDPVVSTAASSQDIVDLEEGAVEAYDSGSAIATSTRALFARLYPIRPASSSSDDSKAITAAQLSSDEEESQSRPVSKASLRLRKMVETHREAPDLSWR